jgi:putative methionine-R-sulfoxide reductase with GAF domain/anti-sigma regulatory factor (Ser/Thr protein kinase)
MDRGVASTDREVEGRLADLQALTDTALTRPDVEDLLDELLSRIQDILDADTAAVLLLEPGADELVARAAQGLEEEVRQGVRVPLGQGFAGRIAATKGPIRLERVDATTVANPLLWEKGIRAMLGVPLLNGGAVIGVLHVGRLELRPFDERDVALLEVVADRIAGAMLLRQLAVEHAAAAMLERSLVPGSLPRSPGIELAARYVPAEDRSVGGDWYDVFRLPSGEMWIVVGDVAGHGLHAAVVMGRVRSALRAYTMLDIAPERVLELVDRKIQHFEIDMIATVAVAVTSPPYELVRLAVAGHPPPVVASVGGGSRLASVRRGPPLGTVPGIRRYSTSMVLQPEDVMVFYTDGLVERRGESLDVGLDLLQTFVTCSGADRVAREVMHGLVGDRPPDDDIALVVVRRTAERNAEPCATGPEPVPPIELDAAAPADFVEAVFPDTNETPGDVRSLVRTTLSAWDLGRHTEIGTLLANELAGNVVRHARTPLTVRVTRSGGVVRIAVDDRNRTPPMLITPGTEGAGGRGIMLVDALSTRWGFEIREDGKSVWFELDLAPDRV